MVCLLSLRALTWGGVGCLSQVYSLREWKIQVSFRIEGRVSGHPTMALTMASDAASRRMAAIGNRCIVKRPADVVIPEP